MTLLLLALQAEWDAGTIYEKSVGEHVRLRGTSIELAAGELVEDDGPAAGFSYRPREETLAPGRWIRKDLIVPDPRARTAALLVAPGGELRARVNGRDAALEDRGAEGKGWRAYGFDPGLLVPGRNVVELSGSGKVWIARDDERGESSPPPKRSGVEGGEYCVRLALDRYRAEGRLRLPTLAGPLKVSLRAEGDVELRARSGPTPRPDASWTDSTSGRFVEVELRLSTSDPLSTPRVHGLTLEGPAPPKAVERNDGGVGRTSIPFRYESYERPELRTLRETERLDEVARGAGSEFELITRLAGWASGRFSGGHLKEAYPPWNALEILKPHADGRPVGGFCQQHNLVFLQACESFGLAGRAVSIGPGRFDGRLKGGGHEVVEIWSNEHAKWVYVDGDVGWYFVEGAPLSLRELRERQLDALEGKAAPGTRVVEIGKAKRAWSGLVGWPPFVELRMIPRSDFLERRDPLPLHQGMRGWSWPGHYVWSDERHAAALIYAHPVSRPADWDWTINQARVLLEPTDVPGALKVHLESETPGFRGYRAGIDGAAREAVESGFTWTLHKGRNRLEVVPRNSAGRDGVVTRVVLDR